MTDFRALCARMADELDHYRQLLMGDCRETHALAAEARAALEATADCNYPSCVDDSPDERCSRWLVGDCPGPCNPERARAALAQPEPQGPTDEEPTDQEIEEWADAAAEVPLEEMDPEVHGWRRCFKSDEFSETIRAALARWGRPVIEPDPQGPTEMEIIAFWSEHCAGDGDAGILRLARWDRPAIEPVPEVEGADA